MGNDRDLRRFLLLAAAAAVYLVVSGLGLRELVAAHFTAGGWANGYLPRGLYLGVMLLVGVVLPLAAALLSWRALGAPDARINLPNRAYWLAPERRASTVAAIRRGMLQFAALLMLFLCYGHGLVVQANQSPTPRLNEPWFVGGLAVFLLAAVFGAVRLIGAFRRRD